MDMVEILSERKVASPFLKQKHTLEQWNHWQWNNNAELEHCRTSSISRHNSLSDQLQKDKHSSSKTGLTTAPVATF